jgi:hypothetical protein
MKGVLSEVAGLAGNVFVWSNVAITYIQDATEIVQLIASIVAVVMSIITARYYWIKTKKLK